MNALDIQFAKTKDGTAIYYPSELKDTVNALREEYRSSLAESEKYLIDITDDTITMDAEKLLKSEDDKSYFVQVPNTAGHDFLNIKKSDVTVINDGKTLQREIANKVIGSYTAKDMEKIEETPQIMPISETKTFGSSNPELQNFLYQKTGDSVILVQETEDSFKYMEIDQGLPRADVEKALTENFDIKDEISTAEILKGLSKEDIFNVPSPVTLKNGISMTSLSTSCVEITNGDKSAIMLKSRIDNQKLSDMGISEEDKQSIIKSFDEAEKAAEKPNKQTLRELKNSAKESREKITSEKKTAKENPTVPI